MEDKVDSLVGILALVLIWILREVVPIVIKKHKSTNGSERMKEEISYLYGREKDRDAVEDYKLKKGK